MALSLTLRLYVDNHRITWYGLWIELAEWRQGIMDLKALVELAKATTLTDEERQQIRQRLTDADEEFARLAEAQRPTQEFLNRTYSI